MSAEETPATRPDPAQPAPTHRGLATVLRDLTWTIQRLLPARAGLDPLPVSELAVLKHVLDAPGITVSGLASTLGLQQSNTSAAVRTLVERGLLVRESDPADRRVTRLVPTAQAAAERNSVDTAWSGTIRSALAQLDAEQLAALDAASGALQALAHALHAERTR